MENIAICPTITAYNQQQYKEQMIRVKDFAHYLHIDLSDSKFTDVQSVGLDELWWYHHVVVDLHLMYSQPMDYIHKLIELQPNTVIIHSEAQVDHMLFAASLHKEGIKTGLALLQDTSVNQVETIIHSFDQVLVFSGHLGHHGGTADLSLVSKVKEIKQLHPDAEIAWDGGINDQNITTLIEAGVDVLNVGGFIQDSPAPADAYKKLQSLSGLIV